MTAGELNPPNRLNPGQALVGLTAPRTRWTVEFLIASAWSALERDKTNPALAERRCRQALSLLVPAVGDGHPFTAAAFDALAWSLDLQKRDQEAETFYLRSLAAQQAAGWPPTVCDDLTGLRLMQLYGRMGKHRLKRAVHDWFRSRDKCSCRRSWGGPGTKEAEAIIDAHRAVSPQKKTNRLIQRRFVVIAPLGMDGPQSVEFVKIAQRFESRIRVSNGEMHNDGKSILGVMTLALDLGAVIEVNVEGPDAGQAMRAIGEHGGLTPER